VLSLLSGSVVEDIADALSDVDMSVVFETLPAEADLRAGLREGGWSAVVLAVGSLADGGLVVAFRLDGVEVQIGYNDLATLHREVDQVLVDHDPDTPQHKLAEGLLKAEPLVGEARLRALQQRLAVFPPALGRAMADHFMSRVTPWRAMSQLLHRDAELWCRELQVAACYKLIGALAGLNGVYFTTFQFKRMTRFAAKLEQAPADFAMRIERLLCADPAGAFSELHALEGEVIDLLTARWPDLDLDAVRERRPGVRAAGRALTRRGHGASPPRTRRAVDQRRSPVGTAGRRFRCRYIACTSVSFIACSAANGITALTALPSGRLPVRSIAAKASHVGYLAIAPSGAGVRFAAAGQCRRRARDLAARQRAPWQPMHAFATYAPCSGVTPSAIGFDGG
jgi:hypothetical protein